jgi:hypothetical protein
MLFFCSTHTEVTQFHLKNIVQSPVADLAVFVYVVTKTSADTFTGFQEAAAAEGKFIL